MAYGATPAAFRPPAVPLITHDPYFSVWSFNDRLTDDWSKHWTGANHAIAILARVDGKCYRLSGIAPRETDAMAQKSLEVWPTRTVYRFESGGVEIGLTFLSPLLPDDIDLLSRPVSYIAWECRAIDGQGHDVSLYADVSAELCVNTPEQKVEWGRYRFGDLEAMRVGTVEQPVLGRSGDDLRIEWGYLYVSAPGASATVIAASEKARSQFAHDGSLPETDDTAMPRAVHESWPVLAAQFDLGNVTQSAGGHMLIAYDDIWSIEYLNRRLKPYWRRNGAGIGDILGQAEAQFAELMAKGQAFDAEFMADLEAAGGPEYARICTLAYRQAFAAQKITADFDGAPMMFSKECFSNGCISTVDVFYPAAPIFLLLNPELLKAQMKPMMDYAQSARWPWPFAPHDLGQYPLANGQVYGGGEKTEENQMPVEETANLLLLHTALAHITGDVAFARSYWPLLAKWADYLREKGLDPENQLCTDDFAGHLAHNANLSVKAILALAGYGRLCEMAGEPDRAKEFQSLARDMAQKWIGLAYDGDHYRLAFDKPGTWSQKYNLVWDKILGLGIFPPEVARTEVAYYKTKLNKYGLPLDNRSLYTKSDWLVWSATLAESPDDFRQLIAPLYAFLQDTPDRVPFTDWYWTDSAKKEGFQARPVIGGVFIKMLADDALWKKWSK
ncbi:MAG: DUF4965 domain-containing protein [Candidatus Hydrogenedentes bacterium]|nr:DUF4965 domain-containing protein [Candidatus Hydrogenedentota bacterium]